jgi:hypothetical protein
MQNILSHAGKLISTSDMKLARKLQQTIIVADITHFNQPQKVQKTDRSISFIFAGEFYELAVA